MHKWNEKNVNTLVFKITNFMIELGTQLDYKKNSILGHSKSMTGFNLFGLVVWIQLTYEIKSGTQVLCTNNILYLIPVQ